MQPERCLGEVLANLSAWCPDLPPLASFDRIIVVGAGKAGAAMSKALEDAFVRQQIDLKRVTGVVNVPNETVTPLRAIRLHPARPAGTNQPPKPPSRGRKAFSSWSPSPGRMICSPA